MIRRDDIDAIRARWLAKQTEPSDLAAVLFLFDELEEEHERTAIERDEARAKLADLTNEWAARRCECGADDFCKIARERDEALVDMARHAFDLLVERTRIRPSAEKDAFRRGAEAMREACATMVITSISWRTRPDEPTADEIAERVRALPLPGDP